jgi:hypothetical protein
LLVAARDRFGMAEPCRHRPAAISSRPLPRLVVGCCPVSFPKGSVDRHVRRPGRQMDCSSEATAPDPPCTARDAAGRGRTDRAAGSGSMPMASASTPG